LGIRFGTNNQYAMMMAVRLPGSPVESGWSGNASHDRLQIEIMFYFNYNIEVGKLQAVKS
jgi:hypothetical protein